jgi:hypothetical protein
VISAELKRGSQISGTDKFGDSRLVVIREGDVTRKRAERLTGYEIRELPKQLLVTVGAPSSCCRLLPVSSGVR